MKLARRCVALLLLFLVSAAPAAQSVRPPAPLTLDGVYAGMRSALQRDGTGLRAEIRTDATLGAQAYTTTRSIWIDAEGEAARVETDTSFKGVTFSMPVLSVIRGNAAYQQQGTAAAVKREALTCRGAPDAVVSLLIGCHGFGEAVSTTTIENDATYEERDAIAVITQSQTYDNNGPVRHADTLYIDPETSLPIAIVSRGRGARTTIDAITRFALFFAPAGEVPGVYFEPSSVGYAAPDVEAPLRSSAGEAFWLGREWVPADGAPLALDSVFIVEPAARAFVGARAVLSYRPADDEFAPATLVLRVWDVADWEREHAGENAIRIGNTVVEVGVDSDSVYASVEGKAAIAAGLRRY